MSGGYCGPNTCLYTSNSIETGDNGVGNTCGAGNYIQDYYSDTLAVDCAFNRFYRECEQNGMKTYNGRSAFYCGHECATGNWVDGVQQYMTKASYCNRCESCPLHRYCDGGVETEVNIDEATEMSPDGKKRQCSVAWTVVQSTSEDGSNFGHNYRDSFCDDSGKTCYTKLNGICSRPMA